MYSAAAKVRTATGGLAQLLPDGGLFVEETAKGRHLRFTPSQLLWSRINYFDAARIGAVELSSTRHRRKQRRRSTSRLVEGESRYAPFASASM